MKDFKPPSQSVNTTFQYTYGKEMYEYLNFYTNVVTLVGNDNSSVPRIFSYDYFNKSRYCTYDGLSYAVQHANSIGQVIPILILIVTNPFLS